MQVRIHRFKDNICVDQLELVIDQSNEGLVWQPIYPDKSCFIFLVDIANPLRCYGLEYVIEDVWILEHKHLFLIALFLSIHQSFVERL